MNLTPFPVIQVTAISVGAAIGALLRWRLGVWLNSSAAYTPLLPWGTLAANLVGGYLIGVCFAVFQSLPNLDPVWRMAIITGFLGGLTTFSSFSVEVVTLLLQERYVLALGTTSLHVGGSLVLTVLGMKSATALLNR